LNTDRWYYRVDQSSPDLISALRPGSAAAAIELGLDASEPSGMRSSRSISLLNRRWSKWGRCDALLDFQGPADLTSWLAANT
jgi:hypothetical protein